MRFESCKEKEQRRRSGKILKQNNKKNPLKSVAFHTPVIDRRDGLCNEPSAVLNLNWSTRDGSSQNAFRSVKADGFLSHF